MLHQYKYGFTYVAFGFSLACYLLGGYWVFGALIFSFFIVPLLELLLPVDQHNIDKEEEQIRLASPVYDWLLYINVPLMYIVLGLFWWRMLDWQQLQTYELLGMVATAGMVLGAVGINVGHELGHRNKRWERLLAKALLLPNFYLHFIIEHNYGHHKNVATPRDPASADYGDVLYLFILRSMVLSLKSAFDIETSRLAKVGKPAWSPSNQVLQFQVVQLLYLGAVAAVLGWQVALFTFVAGVLGICLLETVNYIEHYGLRRKEIKPGIYEAVQPWHSWNSDHTIGRLFLYELSRHSDHHYRASRKYQILRHFDNSPQLPTGYPGMLLLATIPPLWFAVMNPRVRALKQGTRFTNGPAPAVDGQPTGTLGVA